MRLPERSLRTGAAPVAHGRPFRPDIDGLRAIAIVLVLLGHMEIKRTTGGFIGVDIFFVISGYLLTANIAHDIDAGRFSVARFYERRVRRIVPALVAMLLATSVIACVVFPSQVLLLFGQSLFAAIFSYANLYFYTQPEGYFAFTFTKPLLHTWSLGVEEQFYLVLPLCMLFAAKGPPKTTQRVVWVLGTLSFLCAVDLTFVDRKLAFYMPYSRAWELLLGSALALKMLPIPAARPLREALAAVSFALIAGCLFTYTESTPFPGLAALPPCLAAALLIAIGERGPTTVTSFLFRQPALFVGAISYSLYLWHWPVILFLRMGIVPDVRAIYGLALLKIVLSFALATLSWRFVERPFRTGRWKALPRARVFTSAGAAALAVAAFAVIIVAGNGLPGRLPARADHVGSFMYHDETRRGPGCFVETSFADFDPRDCVAPAPGKASVLLLGDSHANAIWIGLARALPGADVLQATGSACAPIEGRYDRSNCGALRRYIYDAYLPAHRVDAVVLTQAWSSIADLTALEPALRRFRERRIPVFVIGPGPQYTASLPMLLALSQAWHIPDLVQWRLVRRLGPLDRALRARLEGRPGVQYASPWAALCSADRCREYADREQSVPLLLDGSHLSDEGAIFAVRRMRAAGELSLPGGPPAGAPEERRARRGVVRRGRVERAPESIAAFARAGRRAPSQRAFTLVRMASNGVSPSGKAGDFESSIRWFESSHPSHEPA